MQFMTALLGGSASTLINSAFALGLVLVLIVLGLWGLKLLTKATGNVGRARQRRLEIVDTQNIDSKRQVIIIRRDNVEHLIMTGGPADLVIESGIAVPEPAPAQPRRPAAAARRPAAPTPAPAADIATPEPSTVHNVPREMVDRLNDLTRPAPLAPRPPAPRSTSLRHTGLLRPVSRQESDVIPMGPSLRIDNSTGAASDSAKPAGDAAGTRTRSIGRNRFFRSTGSGDGAN